MATEQRPKKKQRKEKRIRVGLEQLERFDSLPWNSSLSADDDNATFSLFSGTNELEGGFLSLEEIDEAEYALEIPKFERENKKERPAESSKSNKRKIVETDGISSSEAEAEAESKDNVDEENMKVKPKKKRNKRKKKSKQKEKISEETDDPATGQISVKLMN